ncbi:MAG: Ig-like domain repeat protein, partial [Patescibacteria group bacterium]|nr:Ig-like domain repeat protein [Patescibacteria group bacterium]
IIIFSIDGTAQQPVTISNGITTFTTSTLSVGVHTITAEYSGDTNNTRSVSTPIIQIINQPNKPDTPTGSGGPYELLGLSRTCTCDEVKAKFRELSKKYDPNRGDIHRTPEEREAANKKMREILQARETINKERGCTK